MAEQFSGVPNCNELQPYPEAEYISLAETTKQFTWLRQLLLDLNQEQDAIPINCDNQGALKLVQNPENHQR